MKKHLLSVTTRQDIIFKDLSKELEVSLSELFRRALDSYIEALVEKGTLVRYTFTAGDKTAAMELPKEMFKKMLDYVKKNPDGALKLSE